MVLISYVSIPVSSSGDNNKYCRLPIDHPLIKTHQTLTEMELQINKLSNIVINQ